MKPVQGIYYHDFKQSYIPHILKEIYIDKVYDQYFSGKKDLVVVDLGANIGLFSQYAAEYARIIYAVEPSQQHFECLVTMLIGNGLQNVKPLQLAVSHVNGEAEFFHNANTTMFSLEKAVDDGTPSEKVHTVTLEKFFEDEKIEHVDILKVDIEGAEAKVFGSSHFDAVKEKIDLILGEFHQWTGINPTQFEHYFTERGFEFTWLNKTEASVFSAKRL